MVEKTFPGDLTAQVIPATAGQQFELVIVDALANRIACAFAGLPFLAENGVLLRDNTDGPDWPEIMAVVSLRGFKEISFTGLSPQEVSLSRTTIFYRPNNVFNI